MEKQYKIHATAKSTGDIELLQTDSRERAIQFARTLASHEKVWTEVWAETQGKLFGPKDLEKMP